jgi:hypothetical protein
MKIRYALVSTLIFLAILFLIYYIHVTYLRVNVVFYASIADAMISTSLMGLILFIFSRFNIFTQLEKLQLIIIWLLLGYSLAISLPTVIDRSLSFYILEKLQQRGGGIKLSAFENIFKDEYVKEHHLIEVRITEQEESKTLEIKNGCVLLTKKGNFIATSSRFFRKNFLPKQRLLMGKYSDELTDPFRNGKSNKSYTCN